MSDASARLAPDGATVILERGRWIGSFPLSQLPAQIAFYEELRKRKGEKYAACYAPDVDALRRLQRQLEASGGQ